MKKKLLASAGQTIETKVPGLGLDNLDIGRSCIKEKFTSSQIVQHMNKVVRVSLDDVSSLLILEHRLGLSTTGDSTFTNNLEVSSSVVGGHDQLVEHVLLGVALVTDSQDVPDVEILKVS